MGGLAIPLPTVRHSEKIAPALMRVILHHDGVYENGEPGEVLYNLSQEAGVNYFCADGAMLKLERLGTLVVTRLREPCFSPRRANPIVRIEAQ